ncbi:Wzz/FepE/Etk N-terminal domain-containing protein [Bifidobacterium pullorum]|uniref:Wzz/FepE/Etk N-terminal domain-containing protein n=1 Tax=Bifidobacterium pullorum TaxID=78448 RepID=UPI0032081C61
MSGNVTWTGPEEEGSITLGDLWHAIRKHMVSAVVTLVVVVVAVAAYTFTRTPEYTATAQLFATYQRISGDDGGISEFNSGATYIQSQIQTYP